MAATVAKVKGRGDVQMGARVEGAIADLTGDASYVTGGYAVTPAMFGLKRIIAIIDLGTAITAGATGKILEYDAVNSKVKILQTGGAINTPFAEVANASNQSTTTRRVLALGN